MGFTSKILKVEELKFIKVSMKFSTLMHKLTGESSSLEYLITFKQALNVPMFHSKFQEFMFSNKAYPGVCIEKEIKKQEDLLISKFLRGHVALIFIVIVDIPSYFLLSLETSINKNIIFVPFCTSTSATTSTKITTMKADSIIRDEKKTQKKEHATFSTSPNIIDDGPPPPPAEVSLDTSSSSSASESSKTYHRHQKYGHKCRWYVNA